ncbi:hypothetical protein BGZ68_002763, partial [Mortierella alpina]
NPSTGVTEQVGNSDIIVIESDPTIADSESYDDSENDDDSQSYEASAAAMAADNATYNHKLCPLWGKTALIIDENFFCLFLPTRGQSVDSALGDKFMAAPVCTSELSPVLGTDSLAYNFIKSKSVKKGKDWVQVTGKMEPAKYGLDKKDQGAAYHHGIAKGARCLGYRHFLQFIEPNNKTFCLRCCKRKEDCPVDKSREGCQAAFKL